MTFISGLCQKCLARYASEIAHSAHLEDWMISYTSQMSVWRSVLPRNWIKRPVFITTKKKLDLNTKITPKIVWMSESLCKNVLFFSWHIKLFVCICHKLLFLMLFEATVYAYLILQYLTWIFLFYHLIAYNDYITLHWKEYVTDTHAWGKYLLSPECVKTSVTHSTTHYSNTPYQTSHSHVITVWESGTCHKSGEPL